MGSLLIQMIWLDFMLQVNILMFEHALILQIATLVGKSSTVVIVNKMILMDKFRLCSMQFKVLRHLVIQRLISVINMDFIVPRVIMSVIVLVSWFNHFLLDNVARGLTVKRMSHINKLMVYSLMMLRVDNNMMKYRMLG